MDRALNFAVVSSIALHAALLFGVSMQRDAAKRDAAPAPIQARLVEPPPAPAPPSSPPPQAEPVKPKPQPAPPRRAKRKPAPVPKPESVREPPQPAAPPSTPMAPPAAPAPPSVAEMPGVAETPSVAKLEEQDEARLRDAYRLAVIDAARGHNRYPPLARENNWEGEVRVRMRIGLDGRITALSVEKTSGHAVLDRQALEMFRRAQARVPVPAPLRGKAFNLELRAIYNLKDQVSG